MTRSISAWAIGIVVALVWITADMGLHWTELERYYFSDYLLSQISADGNYRFLYILDSRGWRLANGQDVIRGGSQARAKEGGFPFVLSEKGKELGGRELEWRNPKLASAAAHEALKKNIYGGRTPMGLIGWPCAFSFLLVFGLALVSRRRRTPGQDAASGKILRGPRLVTVSEFNSLKRSDGIRFEVIGLEPVSRSLLGSDPTKAVLGVRKDEETSHFILMGDSGTGKSSLIRQLLTQIRVRGESAVVYDPALEFTPQFYEPTSDIILNPMDKRMPFWSPSDEMRYSAEAAALAGSLFPDRPRDNNFFIEAARKIFAHLLRYHPTPQELTHWMRNIDEMDRRVAGTELEVMIRKSAGGQRAAVQGTLNQAAAAFQLLPSESEAQGRWSAAAWSNERKGWIFLPSLPILRDSLRPLLSTWLDSLILRLMEVSTTRARRVWFILDELSSLQRLPQLPTAITESRKSNIALVIGFQGRSQLETVYGQQAEAMLSQPMTKIFLRTSEPNAAEWVSRSIGEVEIQRLERSQTRSVAFLSGIQRSTSTQFRRYTEPLVLPSTIAGLNNLAGYVKSRDLVVPASFCYAEPEQFQPGFEPRDVGDADRLVLPPAPTEPDTGALRRGRSRAKGRARDKQGPSSQIEIFE